MIVGGGGGANNNTIGPSPAAGPDAMILGSGSMNMNMNAQKSSIVQDGENDENQDTFSDSNDSDTISDSS